MKLSALRFGHKAVIEMVEDSELSLKLFEMGLLPGEVVELENVAPFGDPIAIMIGDNKLCLRLQDADHIQIREIA